MSNQNQPSIEILEQQYPYEVAQVREYILSWNRYSWKYRNKPLQTKPSLEADIAQVKELHHRHLTKGKLSPFITGELLTGERLYRELMKSIRESA